jgi:hypothetical protein
MSFIGLKMYRALLLILSGAVIDGTLAAWGELFATILSPLGYSETQAGKIVLMI